MEQSLIRDLNTLNLLTFCQNELSTFSNEKKLSELIYSTFKKLEPVSDCRICLFSTSVPLGDQMDHFCNNCIFPNSDKEISTFNCALKREKSHCVIPLKTEYSTYGSIAIKISETFPPQIWDAFTNFGNMVALRLENRHQKTQIKIYHTEIEKHKNTLIQPNPRTDLPYNTSQQTAFKHPSKSDKFLEEKFTAAFRNSPVSIVLTTPEKGTILDVNEFFLKYLGYKKEEVIGRTISELGIYYDPQERNNLTEELKMNNFILGRECRLLTKSGTVTTCLLSITYIKIGHQTIQLAIGTDISERKTVEESLKLSEELFRKAFLISPDSININRLSDGLYVNINRGFTEIMGYSEEEIIGKTSTETNIWVNPADREKLVNGLKNEGYVTNLEAKFRKKDGTLTTGLMSGSIIELAGIPHILSITRDIGDLKKIQESLKENEERFRRIFQEGKISMALFGKESNFIKVNDAFCKMIGYSENELLGMNFAEICHPVDVERDWEQFRHLYEGQIAVLQAENKYIRKDKREVWGSVSISAMRDQSGNFIYFIAVINDMTERRMAEEALKKNNSRLELAMKSAKMAWWEMDFNSGFMTFDKRKSEMIDFPPEKFKHYNDFLQLVHPEDVIGIISSMEAHLAGTNEKYEAEYRLLTHSGKYKWFYDIGTIIRDTENGLPSKVNGLVIDISERKQNEEELIKAKDLAEQSDRLKTAFLANMSHEIRTPMNGILGFASLLKIPNLTGDEQQSYIALIERSGVRMLNIINDLITISKVESGLMDLAISNTNINDQLYFLHNFFKSEANQKGIQLLVNCPLPLKEAIVSTDREKLYSVLSNLIKNALKFTKKGSVEFGYNFNNECFNFYVKDTGMGIPKEKHEAVFNRFVQADSSLSRGYEGAGLGLSISKAYVEMLGGTIWIESESGQGTLISFSLPRQQGSVPEQTQPEEDEPAMHPKMKENIILVADDDEDSMLYLSIILGNSGCKIYKATTGEQAVDICRNHSDINLVLMDIKMPKMDGHTAAKIIRDFRPELPIIAQTAYALDKEKTKYGGIFNSYLTKPVRSDELKQKINKYLLI